MLKNSPNAKWCKLTWWNLEAKTWCKNKKKQNNKKQEQDCKVLHVRSGSWPNPNCEILTQKQGAQMKREKTTGNKNKLAKCCTWEATANLNPYCEILRQKQGAQMKRKWTIGNKNKPAKCCTWEETTDLNPYCEILRQKQGAKKKRRRTTRNKNKVAKCCTWEAAADLNPNFERERQNLHRSSLVAADETCSCHITIHSMTALWLFSN
jgi:hypothetical protein